MRSIETRTFNQQGQPVGPHAVPTLADIQDALNRAVNPINTQLTDVGTRMGRVEQQVGDIGHRLGNLETRQQATQQAQPATQPQIERSTFTDQNFKDFVDKTLTNRFDNRKPEIPVARFERFGPHLSGVIYAAANTVNPIAGIAGGGVAGGLAEGFWRGFSRVAFGENAFTLFVSQHKKGALDFMKAFPKYFMDRFSLWEGRLNSALMDKDNLTSLTDEEVERILGLMVIARVQSNIIERRTDENESWKDKVTMVGLMKKAGEQFAKPFKYLADKHNRERDYMEGLKERIQRQVNDREDWLWTRMTLGTMIGSALNGGAAAGLWKVLSGTPFAPNAQGTPSTPTQETQKFLTDLGNSLQQNADKIGGNLGAISRWSGDRLADAGGQIVQGLKWLRGNIPDWLSKVQATFSDLR